MKTLNINGKEYKLEYSFEAAEHKDTVQKMFKVLSGAYLVKANNGNVADTMIEGVSEMVADIPHIVKTAFYSGLLENHGVTEPEAYELMKAYIKENKVSFNGLFEDIKTCMEDDGFFELSGLTEMMQKMCESMNTPKTPQDHKKKKSTSTK